MSAVTGKCRRLLHQVLRAAPCHLRKHTYNVLLNLANASLDLLQWAGRSVAVEVAIEVDLIADDADLAILLVALPGVDPSIGNVRPHLPLEECLDALRQWHALGVTELRVGLRVAVSVATDGGALVTLRERR